MTLSKTEIEGIVAGEEANAIGFIGGGSEFEKKRTKLLEYYKQQPFGDEIEGQSSVVTSDVADVVESMLPSILRLFIQRKQIARFESDTVEAEEEAKEKTQYANWVFFKQNPGGLILHSMIKDALLQFTGMVKVFIDKTDDESPEKYRGLDRLELAKLRADDDFQIEEVEIEEDPGVDGRKLFSVRGIRKKKNKKIAMVNIPPEEMIINKDARDFVRPRIIGHRSPKTRSDLVKMGFNRDVVANLPADQGTISTKEGSIERRLEFSPTSAEGNAVDPSQEKIWLGEYYLPIDINEDGVSEYYKIFFAGTKLLEKPERVDDHPFGVAVPIPMPHTAIGSCPAEQVADIQFWKSTLVRQMNNNIYQNNYGGHAVNENVQLDDLLTPRAAMLVQVEGKNPVQNDIMQLGVTPIVGEILTAIEYADTTRETRTGITRHNQGLDADSLNKTATGFKGMMDASQQRMYLIAALVALNGVTQLMEKIIKLAGRFQNEETQINVFGQVLDIDPGSWANNLRCEVDVGRGVGDSDKIISNLFAIYNEQKALKEAGSLMVDEEKMFAALDEIIVEIGLKDGGKYFNDTSQPDDILKAQNEFLQDILQQFQAQQQNPLAEAEQVKADARLKEIAFKQDSENKQFLLKMEQDRAETEQDAREFRQTMLLKLTELESKFKVNLDAEQAQVAAGQFAFNPQTGRIDAAG